MRVREAYRDTTHTICRTHLEAAQRGEIDPGYALGPVESALHPYTDRCETCTPQEREAKERRMWERAGR